MLVTPIVVSARVVMTVATVLVAPITAGASRPRPRTVPVAMAPVVAVIPAAVVRPAVPSASDAVVAMVAATRSRSRRSSRRSSPRIVRADLVTADEGRRKSAVSRGASGWAQSVDVTVPQKYRRVFRTTGVVAEPGLRTSATSLHFRDQRLLHRSLLRVERRDVRRGQLAPVPQRGEPRVIVRLRRQGRPPPRPTSLAMVDPAPAKPSILWRRPRVRLGLRLGADELRRNRERRTRTMFAKVRSHTCASRRSSSSRGSSPNSVRSVSSRRRRDGVHQAKRASPVPKRAFFGAFFRELVVWNEPEALEPVRVSSSRRSLVDQSLGERSLGERRERLGRRAPQGAALSTSARAADSATRRFAENFWKKFSSPKSATPRLVRSYRNRRASRTCTVAAIVRASQTYRSRHARDGTTRAYAPTDSAATHSTYAASKSAISKTFRRPRGVFVASTLSVPRVPRGSPPPRGRLTRKDTESTPPPACQVPAELVPARRRRAASTAARPTWPPACGDTPRFARRRLPEAPRRRSAAAARAARERARRARRAPTLANVFFR